MKKNVLRRFVVLLSSVSVFGFAFSVTSCEKMSSKADGSVAGMIGVDIREKSIITKSGLDGAVLSRVMPMEGGAIEEYVSDYPQAIATKGAVVSASGFNAINEDGRQFVMNAWLGTDILTSDNGSEEDKANRHFLSATPQRQSGEWELGTSAQWRNGINTTFWSYYVPEDAQSVPEFTLPGNAPTDAQLQSISFKYSLPLPKGEYNDAYSLSDFVVAYNKQNNQVDRSSKLDICFNHPLAAVKFTVGDGISGSSVEGDNDYVNIKSVEIVDVRNSGTFTATGTGRDGCSFTCVPGTDTYTYSQDATRAQIHGTNGQDGFFTSAQSEFVFFMIPQSLDGVKLRITMERQKKIAVYVGNNPDPDHYIWSGKDDVVTFTREFSFNGGEWKPGKYYTYNIKSLVYFGGETISLPDDPETGGVTITEDNKIEFYAEGQETAEGFVAPLNVKDIQVIKVTLHHKYANSSGKGMRYIWLEDMNNGRSTKDADLVAQAGSVDRAAMYWPDGAYQGQYVFSRKGNSIEEDVTMYFYLGGEFSELKICAAYEGVTGKGSSTWTIDIPVFSVSEVVEWNVTPRRR